MASGLLMATWLRLRYRMLSLHEFEPVAPGCGCFALISSALSEESGAQGEAALRAGKTLDLSMKGRSVGFFRSRRVLAGVGLAGAVLVGSTIFALRAGRSEEVVSRAPEWFEDLRLALVAADSEKKDILLEFSRSDRNSNSAETLDPALLDKEPFRRTVGKAFILLRMAATNRMSPQRMTEIATCAQRLGVERFPTFILLDSHGRPYAKSERVAADAASYELEFQKLRKIRLDRDKFLALAVAAKGTDRARHLDDALKLLGPFADSEYADLERQIVELDPHNAAGLKSKYESAVAFRQTDAAIQNEVYPLVDRGNYKAAITRIDRLIVEIKPPRAQLQLLMAFKGQLYYSLGEKKQATQFLDEAIAIDLKSESAGRARAAKLQVEGGR